MSEEKPHIPLAQCKKGFFYKLDSRNLSSGVFNGNPVCPGFIGLREKFGSIFLFTEDHYDNGAPHGTAKPLEEIEQLPDDIEAVEHFATIDALTGREVKYESQSSSWRFVDTGEFSRDIKPTSKPNEKLFSWLSVKAMNGGIKPPIIKNPKDYIGDSVYAEYDGYGIVVTTDNGNGPSNTIYMEPEVIESLYKFYQKERKTP